MTNTLILSIFKHNIKNCKLHVYYIYTALAVLIGFTYFASITFGTSLSAFDMPPKQHRRVLSIKSQIRSIDFRNFRFRLTSELIIKGQKQFFFDLRDGVKESSSNQLGFSLAGIVYGDVTGDSIEEAIVILSVMTGGSALPNCVYIFSPSKARPKLLWSFSTGDRAEKGLRRIYASESGKLMIELYSPKNSKGDCCPQFYTLAYLEWDGNRFIHTGREELLANPQNNASLILPN